MDHDATTAVGGIFDPPMPQSSPPPATPSHAQESTIPQQPTTRLAPSPTGALHLGNARTFLINWALARRNRWRIVLRIEDLDTPRTKPNAAAEAIDILQWLGIDWDDGPYYQANDLAPYEQAMRELASNARVFPTTLSRKEIEQAASAPHPTESHELPFPPELRPPLVPLDFDAIRATHADQPAGWRFATPDDHIHFDDAFLGTQSLHPRRTIGDFVVWTRQNQPAYQLAVVVDDHRHGITHVVRADDLLDSTPRQILLFRALGYDAIPTYTHLPLVVGEDGRRLAKRHGDTRLAAYRDAGVPPERIIGLIAHWSSPGSSTSSPEPMTASEFAQRFSLDTMPRCQTIFTQQHDAWLRAAD